MKRIVLFSMAMLACYVHAWNSVSEMERDFCLALTNQNYLLSAPFTNQLVGAANCVDADSRCEVFMLGAIHAGQSFAKTADEHWLHEEMRHASNAVVTIGVQTNKWQYWMARFVYAGAYASQDDYGKSLTIMTNSLAEIASSGFTNEIAPVGRAMLRKFEMEDIDICEAMKVMAGMSAAAVGEGSLATNYAHQVSVPYRKTILEFME